MRWTLAAGIVCCLNLVAGAEEISFSRQVQPILAKHCFACHGPDEGQRQAELRLDLREVAVEKKAIAPGKPDQSELVTRIDSDDIDLQMPPPAAHAPLSDSQKQLLKQWIAEGAKYEAHWAFVPPQQAPLPPVKQTGWARNPVDSFVLAELEKRGMKPSPKADSYTLVRRVYLDLIGLPPTPEEADSFVNDADPRAYEKLVNRLLESPQYGERWARLWLDLARYADTNGYEKDRPRSIWPYRDWVVNALNTDMPYDQFTVEQLAGDMLPKATLAQKIATGFHRNTMLNEEGGIDPLEFRFYAMVDRVATTGIVWMGLTTGCAQCHSHKYDPISHRDYYRLMALMDNADEPDLSVLTPEIANQRTAVLQEIEQLEATLPSQFPPAPGDGPEAERRQQNLEASLAKWLQEAQLQAYPWQVLKPSKLESNLPLLTQEEDGAIFSSGDITKRDVFTLTFPLDQFHEPIQSLRLEVLPDERLPAHGPGRSYYEGRQGDFFLSEVTAERAGQALKFSGASHSYGKISIGNGAEATNVIDSNGSTGWSTAEQEGRANQLVLNFAEPVSPQGELKIVMLFERHFAASLGRFRFSATTAAKATAQQWTVELEAILARNRQTWSEDENQAVRRYFLSIAPELAEARKKIDEARKRLPAVPTTMVLQERPANNPRETFRHHRGEYLSPEEKVEPGVLSLFPPLPENESPNRLTFARWLVSDRNPLAARVAVNRAWQAFFGAGLVRSNGDFGTQSEPPTHPELLDWLAVEFVKRGWSQKQLHRLIVTSATYRQSSAITAELLEQDPDNRWLARGPRHRVDAEMVRDITLQASGLLVLKQGGPGVYPPQPESVTELAYGSPKWNTTDPHRRSLYTFTKRTAPFAAFTVFDGPTGETCTATRNRSNTPLQALTLLNDDLYVELAAALGHLAVQKHPDSDDLKLTFIFRRLLTRPPTESEVQVLSEYRTEQVTRLEQRELIPADIGGKDATPESASWIMLARVVMNLDEAITKE